MTLCIHTISAEGLVGICTMAHKSFWYLEEKISTVVKYPFRKHTVYPSMSSKSILPIFTNALWESVCIGGIRKHLKRQKIYHI